MRRAATSRAEAPPAAQTQAPRLASRSADPRHHGVAPQLPRRAPQRAVVRLECLPPPQCSRPRAGGAACGPAPGGARGLHGAGRRAQAPAARGHPARAR
eukprot:4329718-Alexandrium_andersonii.AAC.1